VISGLLVQAFRKVMRVDPGFRADNVLTWRLRLPPAGYLKAAQQLAFFHNLADRLKSLPTAVSVSSAAMVPLGGHTGYFYVAENPRPGLSATRNPVVLQITALPGYVESIGMKLLKGRTLTVQDEAQGAPRVAIINETFARHFWGTTDAVGRRIRHPYSKEWAQVIGVVQDTRHYGLDANVRPSVLVPFSLYPLASMTMVLRTAADPHGLVPAVRDVIRQTDPDLPMFDVQTMRERLDQSLMFRRTYSWLCAAFAFVAVVLAAAGIYGVISFAVSQRTREIGIRIALGARPDQVMRGVLASGMVLVAAGVVLGLLASQLTARFLRMLLFGLSTRDAATYLAVLLGIAVTGLPANWFPARRAARVDPINTLRAE
jgi:putative ABC transport system permease protein